MTSLKVERLSLVQTANRAALPLAVDSSVRSSRQNQLKCKQYRSSCKNHTTIYVQLLGRELKCLYRQALYWCTLHNADLNGNNKNFLAHQVDNKVRKKCRETDSGTVHNIPKKWRRARRRHRRGFANSSQQCGSQMRGHLAPSNMPRSEFVEPEYPRMEIQTNLIPIVVSRPRLHPVGNN